MGRPRIYTDELYNDRAKTAWSAMRRTRNYTKPDILELAGFQRAHAQHWPRLRNAFAREGLGLSYDFSLRAWVKGTYADYGGLSAMWNELERRWGRALRKDMVEELQQEGTAEDIVAFLVEKGVNPIAVASLLSMMTDDEGTSLALPEEVEAALITATRGLLPEMAPEVRTAIERGFESAERIAGLLED